MTRRLSISDKVRAEMIGILAWEVMAHQGFDSRILVGPFDQQHTNWGGNNRDTYYRGTPEARLIHDQRFPTQGPSAIERYAAYSAGAVGLF